MQGVFTDFIAKGKYLYILLASIIFIEMLYIFFLIIYGLAEHSGNVPLPEKFNFWCYGFIICLTTVIQLYQIPLFIAGKYRDLNNPWELPLAGQLLAVAQVFVLWLPGIVSVSLEWSITTLEIPVVWERVIVFIMLGCSLLPLLKMVKFERNNFVTDKNDYTDRVSESNTELFNTVTQKQRKAEKLAKDFNLEIEI